MINRCFTERGLPVPESRQRNLKPLKSRAAIKSRWHMADSACLAVGLNLFMVRTAHEFQVGEDLECAIDLPDAGTVHCQGKVANVTPCTDDDFVEYDYEIKIVGMEQDNEGRLRAWLGEAAPPPAAARPAPAAPRARPAAAAAPAAKPAAASAASGKGKRMDPRELQRVLQQLKKKRSKT